MDNLLLRAEFGSRAYGTSTVDSDTDLVQIVVEPREEITGLSRADDAISVHTAKPGERSTAVDTDTTTYTLQKFAKLAAVGNPSILSALFVSEYEYLAGPWGQALVDNRDKFVSLHAGHRFMGYMVAQRAAMLGEKNKRTNRPELVHKYGFDTKFAYHMIRLGMLGHELMFTGTMVLPMGGHSVQTLMDIRAGKYTKDEVLAMSYDLEADLEKSFLSTSVPAEPDRQFISDLMHHIYMDYWEISGA